MTFHKTTCKDRENLPDLWDSGVRGRRAQQGSCGPPEEQKIQAAERIPVRLLARKVSALKPRFVDSSLAGVNAPF